MILKVNGLEFTYHERPVLKNIGFELKKGQIMAVLGVNGAGKTTLLKCLNRILRLRMGTVFLDEENVKDMSRNHIAKHFAYVPQKYEEEPLTVFDAILLGRRPYIKWEATSHDLRIVEAILYRLDIEYLALRPTNQLSGGEMQKVIIARALAQEPEVLLLDEPTSNLDLKNQLQVMQLVTKAVREHNMAAIVSMHDINLAFRFVDHFLMLREGRVHLLAPREEVTAQDIEKVYGVKVILGDVDQYKIVIPVNENSEGAL
ncbi:MAG: ABC transporter ATP-binding protein [Deltaproteobacteria bacterium]|nr:ABC transporter ATP-binding protein [Deltaproteobacteria bacterium]